ncbi:MAG: type I DNA topoisomerase [Phycisphaerales bacterium]|nr:type I DNA topoisomerase [Phycisphaerales bacterium]
MAKKAAKKPTKKTAKKAATEAPEGAGAGSGGRAGGRRAGSGYKAGAASGKQLVIVESPSKAKTINKYLGSDYVVLASVGHVRDLPSKAAKGDKSPVPGVNLEKNFAPTYEIVEGKGQLIRDLKRAAKDAISSGGEVWFATDLDREGEAIAWHLAQELGIESKQAKRVIFPAITKSEIAKAFSHPHPIDEDRVNAQQARRILDRIVGYQVSPLLWKKVARGLSAGRVQSVAVRLVVDREREIRKFIPEEYWDIEGVFALSEAEAAKLGPRWREFLGQKDEKGAGPTVKAQNAWLGEHSVFRASLVEVGGEKLDLRAPSAGPGSDPLDLTPRVREIAEAAGLKEIKVSTREDASGKGPARFVRTVSGVVDPKTPYKVAGIETKRTKSRPAPPFITSTLQQAASTRLGFAAQRTMRTAQSLYEGVDIPGEGPVGLITYMRTDSTHISGEALTMARDYIGRTFGDKYLPEKPNFYTSSNKAAQEAHEAIRPTSLAFPPEKVKRALNNDQFRLYQLVWERFVACQMVPAEWDATTVTIVGGSDEATKRRSDGGKTTSLTFRASGRVLVFDGHYRVSGVPNGGDEATLPKLAETQPLSPVAIDPRQKFTAPPSRYSEASLIKTLESEGIGRPSTYASIIQVIQNRKYVEQLGRAFYATDLGEVVTDKLVEAFPKLMDLGYTRQMETQLDQIEEEHLDWIEMLSQFYQRFKTSLDRAHEELGHAKAEIVPAPPEYRCEKCGSSLVYRFGKNGRFLSCSTYPDCNYAAPVDRDGKPRTVDVVNVRCPKTGCPMARRTGRFGPFLATILPEGAAQGDGLILNIDKKGHVNAPSQPPILTDLECEKCGKPLNLRTGARGPWLGCSGFPKCRGRGKWAGLPDDKKAALEAQLETHDKAHPIPIITTLDGRALTDKNGKPVKDAPTVDQLVLESMEEAERLARGEVNAVA